MKWLEVGLTVEEELVEPVADVLSRHVPGGVAMSPMDPGQQAGQRLVVVHAYLEDGPELEAMRRRIEHDLWYLSRIRPFSSPEFNWVEGRDWEEAWKGHFKPMLVGDRLRIQPAWLDRPTDGRLDVLIDPGMAFGTGAHPTTQLCLELLEQLVRPDDLVADLGCGSGILSIAAVKLGARRCLAYDIDAQSVATCRENAKLNGVSQQIATKLGSLDELEIDAQGNVGMPRVVVANIVLAVLGEMFDGGLRDTFESSGLLIASGVLADQADALVAKARPHGLQLVDLRQREEWRALVFEK